MTHVQTVAVDHGRPSVPDHEGPPKAVTASRSLCPSGSRIEETSDARAQCLDAVDNRPGFGHDRFALWRELWLAGRPAIEQRKTELRLQSVENVREAIRPEAGHGPIRHPADCITNAMAQIPGSGSRARLVSGAIAVGGEGNLACRAAGGGQRRIRNELFDKLFHSFRAAPPPTYRRAR